MRIGVDLGGTKIEVIAIDSDDRPILRERIATPRGDYRATVAAVAELVRRAEDRLGRSVPVGLGIPGTISPATGLVKNANSTWLIGRPLPVDLEAALGRKVRITNDANCFALSEARAGAGRGHEVVFGVILGTGVGGGLVIGGKIVTGANAIAGEWGHNPLPGAHDGEYPGPECYCGRRGCIETFLSGPGLARDHETATGRKATAEEIVALAGRGDAAAAAALLRYQDRLARALAGVINIVDPDCIVLGGGLSNVAGLYDTVPALWGRHVFSDTVVTRLVPPARGDSSGVWGAAWLWPDPDGDRG